MMILSNVCVLYRYYNLVLEASDMGSDPKSTTVNVTVTVTVS